MRYFRIRNKKTGWISIWETNDKKTKERLIYSSNKEYIDLEKMRKIWTRYTPPGDHETEKEITREDAFGEML